MNRWTLKLKMFCANPLPNSPPRPKHSLYQTNNQGLDSHWTFVLALPQLHSFAPSKRCSIWIIMTDHNWSVEHWHWKIIKSIQLPFTRNRASKTSEVASFMARSNEHSVWPRGTWHMKIFSLVHINVKFMLLSGGILLAQCKFWGSDLACPWLWPCHAMSVWGCATLCALVQTSSQRSQEQSTNKPTKT